MLVGPEFIAGSTRLKAGTAQKLVLNMLSTLTMVRLGKTYGNLMVDVRVTNEKLRDRATRIVEQAAGASREEAAAALDAAGEDAKVAIAMLRAGVDAERGAGAARRRRRPPAPRARRMSREAARASDSTTRGCETRRSRVIGLMSGTSFDAIDAAAADIELEGDVLHLRPLGSLSAPYDDDLREELAAALPPAHDHARDRLPAGHADRPGLRGARRARPSSASAART